MAIKIRAIRNANELLSVSSNFATLLDIEPDGTFVYEFEYRASTYSILRNRSNDNCVEILVHKELPKPPKLTIRKINRPGDLRAFTRDILTSGARARDISRKINTGLIARADSDLTAKVSKEAMPLLATTVPAFNLARQVRAIDVQTVEEIEDDNKDTSILQTTTMSEPIQETQQETQAASVSMMFQGFDPSNLFGRMPCINGTFSNFSGTKSFSLPVYSNNASTGLQTSLEKKQKAVTTKMLGTSLLQLSFRKDLRPKMFVPIITYRPRLLLRYDKTVRIPNDRVENDDFYVEFRLKGDDGRVKEKVIKRVPHRLLNRIFSTPRDNPSISIAPFQFAGRNTIDVMQQDDKAVAVRIFKRTHTWLDLDMLNNQYKQVAEIPLRKEDGLVKFVDITNNFRLTQYRAVAVGPGGFIGAGFDNAVAPSVKQPSSQLDRRLRGISICVENISGGISIVVSNVALGIVSVAVLRRDLTLHENDFEIIDTERPIKLVINGLGDVNFLDEDVSDDHIYEYSARLYYDDGVELQASTAIQQRFKISKFGEADIVIDGPEIINQGTLVDVQFGVSSVLKEGNLDSVKIALERQGLSALFGFDLEEERDKLQKLIAHSIKRINLVTGETEDFGTFIGQVFSDRQEGIKALVKPLKRGNKYRYIINTLLRAPETLFDDFEKEAKDETTGRTYIFKPAKFLHPISLQRGTIVDRQTLNSNHPEDDFAFGFIGNAEAFNVNIPFPKIKLRDVNVTRVDKRNVCLRWTVDGPKRNVEHYVVLKEMLRMTSIAGKVHHISSTSTFEFFDRLEPDDIGEIKYSIVPVMNDFSTAQRSIGASLIVRDGRI